MDPAVTLIAVFILLPLVVFIVWLGQPTCPNCGNRGTIRWLHQRKEGGPDGRYKENYQTCSRCDWVSPDEAERRIKAEEDNRRAQTVAIKNRAVAEEAQVQREAKAKRQRETEARSQEAKRLVETQRKPEILPSQSRTVEEQRNAEAAAERQRQLRLDMEQRDAAEAPLRAFIWLLKYVAMADRRFMEGERQMIIRYVKGLFPKERESALVNWAESLSPDSFHLTDMLTAFKDVDEDRRKELFGILNEMTTADGKTTPAEKARLEEIRKGLNL